MLYELASLSCPLLVVDETMQAACAWADDPKAAGRLLGCWRTEIGTLGRVLILRGFEAPEEMTIERRRALMSANPFNAGSLLAALEMESYAPFPFLPPVQTGQRGGVYEARTYRLKPGGLTPTLDGWKAALKPARPYTDHLVVSMYALDGPSRITHIWAFESLEQRTELRANAYAAGVWPPRGAPEQIAEATSTIALPFNRSPLW